MHLTLTATGISSKVKLWTVEVDDRGHWVYESRSVEHAEGHLTEGDRAQLISLYEKVDWSREVLNNPISADDDIHFRFYVVLADGDRRTYTFSEALNHVSYQFRDLVHFLRHNVLGSGDPVGRIPGETHDAPPAEH
ncbi:MAG TPA: hypothetical protein VD969_17740 [Symbiobacteriaceae bacterium]|nr:hypothetical protein [Symbiobacteriaceae bacterium]